MNEIARKIADSVPTNWLDPILTGPAAVNLDGVDGRKIESLLLRVKERVMEVAADALAKQDSAQPVAFRIKFTTELDWTSWLDMEYFPPSFREGVPVEYAYSGSPPRTGGER